MLDVRHTGLTGAGMQALLEVLACLMQGGVQGEAGGQGAVCAGRRVLQVRLGGWVHAS